MLTQEQQGLLVPGLCCATVGVVITHYGGDSKTQTLPEDPDDHLIMAELKGKVVCQGKIVEGKTPAKKRPSEEPIVVSTNITDVYSYDCDLHAGRILPRRGAPVESRQEAAQQLCGGRHGVGG